ncbi:MAG TPA: TIGR02266 family protein [Myxococcaceae bacterium]|nr:TIGR02266 family protein [Myxococcaceae bacterium]
MPSPKPPLLLVALREGEANLEVRVEVASYPRAAVEQLTQQVPQSGGTLVELWRLPKAERDTFRAASLANPKPRTVNSYAAAAELLERHIQELAARGSVPAGAPPGPGDAPAPATPAAPDTEEHGAKRRAQRFAVRLEMEFRTELDFVREHATNISNGGLFVRTAHRPPVDSVVTVSVRLPNGELLQGEALVVHTVDDPYTGGVGLAFLSEDSTFEETLDRYLASLVQPTT